MSVLRYPFRPPRVGPPNIRKRALLRAIARAEASATRTTWYRGRQMDVTQLRGGGTGPVNSSTGRQPTVARSTLRHAPRLRVLSWNSGGLNSVKYKEVLVWLQCAHEAGQTYDICVLQETAWPHDSEFVAKVEGSDKLQWHAIHSAGKGHDGILCLVRAGLIPAENLRYQVVEPGRLVHLRLLFSAPLDLLCVYQWAWNAGKAELKGKNRIEEMTRQRRRVWQSIDRWLGSIPQRSTCLLAGDFNCTLESEAPRLWLWAAGTWRCTSGSGIVPGNST